MTRHNTNDLIFIRNLTEIVLTNLGNENFGVKELIRESGMTYFSLSRRLHEVNNKTINQFIRETRLLKAREMLQNKDLTASEVAYKTGFGSPAYFNKCFHEFFGYPPGKVKSGDFEITEEPDILQIQAVKTGKNSVPRVYIYAASGIFLLAVLVYLLFTVILKNPGNSLKYRERSIAVLPFKNLSEKTSNQYFVEGVMEDILTNLCQIHDLRVISRTSVEQFRGSSKPTSEIARKLDVNYIVEGSGQLYGNTFGLRVQLIDASTDKHIWAKSYEREIDETKDIFSIQNSVALSIAEELKATITPEEKRKIEKIPTSNLTAYNLYQRANSEFSRYPFPYFNKESLKKAEILYLNALKCDSTFALAYVGLAYVLWKRWDQDNSLLQYGNINNYMDSMLVLANKALALDDQNADAFNVRGEYYAVKGSADQAMKEWRKALTYNPNSGAVYSLIGGMYEELDMVISLENLKSAAFLFKGSALTQTLTTLGYDYYKAGFPEQGDFFLQEALKLDDDSIRYLYHKMNCIAYTTGDYKKAVENFEKRYSADTTNTDYLLRLGYYNSLAGNDKESLKYYKKYLSAINDVNEYNTRFTRITRFGYAYFKCGFRKEADYYLRKQLETCQNRLLSVRPGEKIYWLYPLAGAYLCMGNKAKAYESLKTFNRAKSFTLEWVTLFKTDPIFNTIRNEPEFQQIVRDVEAKYISEHERVEKWLKNQGKL